MENLINIVVENQLFFLIIVFLIAAVFPWLGLNFSKITSFQMPFRLKIFVTFSSVFMAVLFGLMWLGSVNQTPDIKNQILYNNENENLLVFNLDKVGNSFSSVTSFYVFQRGQKPDLYIGMMKFDRGSKNAFSGKFKDYSVHGLCEGDIKVSRIEKDKKLEFQLEFDAKNVGLNKKSKEFCKDAIVEGLKKTLLQ